MAIITEINAAIKANCESSGFPLKVKIPRRVRAYIPVVPPNKSNWRKYESAWMSEIRGKKVTYSFPCWSQHPEAKKLVHNVICKNSWSH